MTQYRKSRGINLCHVCGGNGVLRLHNGVEECRHCDGEGWASGMIYSNSPRTEWIKELREIVQYVNHGHTITRANELLDRLAFEPSLDELRALKSKET